MSTNNRNLPIVREIAREFGLRISKVVERGKHVQVYLHDNHDKRVRLTVRHSQSRPDFLRDWLRQDIRRAMRS
jgi:hypothetical protein